MLLFPSVGVILASSLLPTTAPFFRPHSRGSLFGVPSIIFATPYSSFFSARFCFLAFDFELCGLPSLPFAFHDAHRDLGVNAPRHDLGLSTAHVLTSRFSSSRLFASLLLLQLDSLMLSLSFLFFSVDMRNGRPLRRLAISSSRPLLLFLYVQCSACALFFWRRAQSPPPSFFYFGLFVSIFSFLCLPPPCTLLLSLRLHSPCLCHTIVPAPSFSSLSSPCPSRLCILKGLPVSHGSGTHFSAW